MHLLQVTMFIFTKMKFVSLRIRLMVRLEDYLSNTMFCGLLKAIPWILSVREASELDICEEYRVEKWHVFRIPETESKSARWGSDNFRKLYSAIRTIRQVTLCGCVTGTVQMLRNTRYHSSQFKWNDIL